MPNYVKQCRPRPAPAAGQRTGQRSCGECAPKKKKATKPPRRKPAAQKPTETAAKKAAKVAETTLEPNKKVVKKRSRKRSSKSRRSSIKARKAVPHPTSAERAQMLVDTSEFDNITVVDEGGSVTLADILNE